MFIPFFFFFLKRFRTIFVSLHPLKEFSKGKYDIAEFEKTERNRLETWKKQKKMYLDLIEDYIKTDLLSMKKDQEERDDSASRFLKALADFVGLL